MGKTMRRRELLTMVGGVILMSAQSTSAQSTVAARRIGVLMSVTEHDPEGQKQFLGFRQRLAELGWNDGRNLTSDCFGGQATYRASAVLIAAHRLIRSRRLRTMFVAGRGPGVAS